MIFSGQAASAFDKLRRRLAGSVSGLGSTSRWHENPGKYEMGKLSFLLMQRTDSEEWKNMVRRGLNRPDKEDYFFPETCLVHVDVEESFIYLEPQSLLQMMPDISPIGPTDTYLSSHKPFGLIPVLLGFFWEDALEPEDVAERWPFLPEEE